MKGQKKKKNFDLLIYAEMRPKQRDAHMLFEFFFMTWNLFVVMLKAFYQKKESFHPLAL